MPVAEADISIYRAYGAARETWSSKAKEILIYGPAGTGKSRLLLEKMNFCAMKYPGFRGLILRKTRESMNETVLATFEDKVLPPDSMIRRGPKRNLRQYYQYPNGSRIVVGGLDKSTKIMSSDYDMVAVFEGTELSEDDFENLTSRLRNYRMPYQQVLIDCNPAHPTHWLWRRSQKGSMATFFSKHEDNPFLYDHKADTWTREGVDYLSRLDNLTGVRRTRLLLGKWAAAEGLVFENWNPDVHLIFEKDLPPDFRSFRKFRAIDFGFIAPFVCQWWAIDGDGRMYMYRELYGTRRLVKDWVYRIQQLSEDEEIEATVADHDAEGRATMEEEGLYTVPAWKENILAGIEKVELRLKVQQDQKPMIYFMHNALVEPDPALEEAKLPFTTVQEFDSYIWAKNQEGKPVKEKPLQINDHGMDTTRYAVAYADGASRIEVYTEAPAAA